MGNFASKKSVKAPPPPPPSTPTTPTTPSHTTPTNPTTSTTPPQPQTHQGGGSKYVRTAKRKMCKDGIDRVLYTRGSFEYVRMKNKKTNNIEFINYNKCKAK